MATWKFEYSVDMFDMSGLFRELMLRWVRVDGRGESGSRRFVIMSESGYYLKTVIRAAMFTVGNLHPGLALELRDVYCDGGSYGSFLITSVEREY
jgi:hypothetical protein